MGERVVIKDGERFAESPKVVFSGQGRTRKEHQAECDVNRIMDRYRVTGAISHLTSRRPVYGEFADVPSFLEAQQLYVRALEGFEALPAELRKRVGNSPAEFLAFALDPENRDELVKYGLVDPAEPVTPPEEPAPAPAAPEEPAD